MHLENSRERSRLWGSHAWVLVTGGLWAATSLMACSSLKSDLCATVHTHVLEELRTSDGAARYVLDPSECERSARNLHHLAEELRALEIHDAALHAAVDAYRAELERLSDDYGRLAAAYLNNEGLPPQEAQRLQATLSRGVQEHASAMNALRLQVHRACEL